MHDLERLGNCGVVPVVVLDDAVDAVDTANALLKGGVDVMEITFRTSAAAESIRRVAENCPDILVGAGTVVSLEQCVQAIQSGAKFIVSPGYDDAIVSYCMENGLAVTPGCVTPTEIMAAIKQGCRIIKFFPAGVFGGLAAMKALSGPFPQIRFIPTGGVNNKNLSEYIRSQFIFAVGGSWMCPKTDIAEKQYDSITKKCKEARDIVLGYDLALIHGVSAEICSLLSDTFGFPVKQDSVSCKAGHPYDQYLGADGHVAVFANDIVRAMADIEKKGLSVDTSIVRASEGKKIISCKIGGFGDIAVHLIQR